ncbi:DUF5060 domain-containing protein [Methylocapsa sp. S129]|uniref:DUF5060 domain-containing protein n=1 Tax=Methylocapsa sp. S129 TaxID=1641869 RepID=UPI00131C417A|nr:DUF5060 domain-containing protein [Methylocapsa sp. S129]
MDRQSPIAQWDIFEAAFQGPAAGNPYLDVTIEAVFSFGNRDVRVPGFYDGEGIFRVRFMPDAQGEWRYRTIANVSELDGRTGSFACGGPRAGMHGPVHVRDKFHFAHADGKPYFPFGTTCYAWTHQPLAMQAQTLATLKDTRFNKLRMGVFPKDYIYNQNEPLYPAFETGADGKEDFDRPNATMFRHFENQVGALRELGVEADIIIFHPYDRWGYCDMGAERDFRYLRYLVARLAAYANVWWSLANEYDFLLDCKPIAQWDRYFHIIEENDPYRHLKSIHNGEATMNFDHRKPWVDHVCIQNWDVKRTAEWREAWGKPIVNDEPEYEGDIPRPWGNISAIELVHRFWVTIMRGGYAGHGETFMHPEDLLWWAKGGELRGESWKRIGFLRDLIEADVKHGLTPFTPQDGRWVFSRVSGASDGDVTYLYFGEHQPAAWAVGLPMEDGDYEIDLIDIWAMTIERIGKAPLPASPGLRQRNGAIVGGEPEAAFGIHLPGKPYQAVRIRVRK